MVAPEIALTLLSGSAEQPVVVVGPSLGTRVERLWSTAAALLSDYRVIGWDLPGHGRSAPATQPFSTEELASAVLGAVDAEVGADAPLRYAGDSFGGAVGLQLILDHPDRFEAAAILCSGAKIATVEVWRGRVDLVCREGLGPVQRASPERWFGERVKARPTDESRAVVEELADIDAASYCGACAALAAFDVRDRLSAIQVPLLAVAGSDDLVTTAEQHGELVCHTPGASFEVLPGVGHLAPLEDPSATAALLEKHFAKESG
ncbi:alpha/beta fold hydrolase [Flexivirga alba]|uniref:Alpha/beta fold hydrolase n=1 Tax=Flexivirga alba TaxID=702742 RepID=A0ABW2AJ82_9MICO